MNYFLQFFISVVAFKFLSIIRHFTFYINKIIVGNFLYNVIFGIINDLNLFPNYTSILTETKNRQTENQQNNKLFHKVKLNKKREAKSLLFTYFNLLNSKITCESLSFQLRPKQLLSQLLRKLDARENFLRCLLHLHGIP